MRSDSDSDGGLDEGERRDSSPDDGMQTTSGGGSRGDEESEEEGEGRGRGCVEFCVCGKGDWIIKVEVCGNTK